MSCSFRKIVGLPKFCDKGPDIRNNEIVSIVMIQLYITMIVYYVLSSLENSCHNALLDRAYNVRRIAVFSMSLSF